ncbi:MAG: hypothetical protein HC882_01350 [Acidobacteria bacterium]|nr:hypothetical protein [Acidobacteriota bacterium]
MHDLLVPEDIQHRVSDLDRLDGAKACRRLNLSPRDEALVHDDEIRLEVVQQLRGLRSPEQLVGLDVDVAGDLPVLAILVHFPARLLDQFRRDEQERSLRIEHHRREIGDGRLAGTDAKRREEAAAVMHLDEGRDLRGAKGLRSVRLPENLREIGAVLVRNRFPVATG